VAREVGRTNLKECASLIEASALHLDNESGLVHLAAARGSHPTRSN
jgi:ADP-heptose:LPS heptosyltransferase